MTKSRKLWNGAKKGIMKKIIKHKDEIILRKMLLSHREFFYRTLPLQSSLCT